MYHFDIPCGVDAVSADSECVEARLSRAGVPLWSVDTGSIAYDGWYEISPVLETLIWYTCSCYTSLHLILSHPENRLGKKTAKTKPELENITGLEKPS